MTENESNDNLMAVVKSFRDKINVPFDQDNINCAHRVGNKYTNENAGKMIQSIIIEIP